ncbi:2-amino-4-hydroxy-6-hydroxymethyldihydropteridine diphosphokinase [Terrihabitans sp. B22-R8]|uniref:2-amino-4-hydroxy-6- hydroxymethyldihydropteridine diphosphokinase n=1 Tax=Terrihabitans sp. B22-R8 TaxID=3425128 RepID=UPI00403C4E70
MAEAGLGLGSNLGEKAANIRAAVTRIAQHPDVRLLRRSALYRTAPWGDEDQDWFLNACIIVETKLSPRDLLRVCHEAETLGGRARSKERRWGPRQIDVDILFYDDVALDDADLALPHPRLTERAFVLIPLAEIAGDRVIGGRTVSQSAALCLSDDIVQIGPL